MQEGEFTPVLGKEWEEQLKTVFNRGFWGGYYLGEKLGVWSQTYGNKATLKKTYVGYVTNYYAKPGVAQVKVEAVPLHKGEDILIIGPTTGVLEDTIREIHVLTQTSPAESAPQGTECTFPVGGKVRKGDKLFKVELSDHFR